MNSMDERATWLERHREVVREIRPDSADATAKLALAERDLDRARKHADADPDLALVAAESALVNIADAVLAREGLRLRGKTGSHEARFSFPGLPSSFREHSAVITAARKSRNTVLYESADTVSPRFITEVTRIVETLIDEVRGR